MTVCMMSLNAPLLHHVTNRLSFGNLAAGHRVGEDVAIVHACKDPCHKTALRYQTSLSSSHPHYLQL